MMERGESRPGRSERKEMHTAPSVPWSRSVCVQHKHAVVGITPVGSLSLTAEALELRSDVMLASPRLRSCGLLDPVGALGAEYSPAHPTPHLYPSIPTHRSFQDHSRVTALVLSAATSKPAQGGRSSLATAGSPPLIPPVPLDPSASLERGLLPLYWGPDSWKSSTHPPLFPSS